jgi:hypothetical protein
MIDLLRQSVSNRATIMPSTRRKSARTSDRDLAADAREAYERVRRAWAALLAALPGAPLARANQLSRALKLSPKLGWQVWRFVHAESAHELIDHLPGEQGLAIVLRAAAKAGVPAAVVRGAEASLRSVQELIRRHAGDRASLSMMLGGGAVGHAGADARARSDEEHRRLAFLGASYLWGVQARTSLHLSILHAGRNERVIDIAAIRGVIDLRRLRPDLPWIVARGCRPGEHKEDGRYREPLSGRSTDPGRAPIVEEFCSSPTPDVRVIPVSESLVDLELAPGKVGDVGSVTCMVGEALRNLPRYKPSPDSRGRLTPVVFTPSERFLMDVIVHPGAVERFPLRVGLYGDPRGEGLNEFKERNRLPIPLAAEPLGRGIDAIDVPYIPRYRELVLRAHEMLGWRAADFETYRIQLTYPPCPCGVSVEWDLPQGGGGGGGGGGG